MANKFSDEALGLTGEHTLSSLYKTQAQRDEIGMERIRALRLEDMHPFPNHPFRVRDDAEMRELVNSIKSVGLLTPIIVRPREAGGYEIIAGHRRHYACTLLGMETVPTIVKEIDDDDAAILMVDSNLQREDVLPSEKAHAYKIRLEAMARKAGRRGKSNSPQLAANYRGDDAAAQEAGISGDTLRRFVRLTELAPELLEMVDEKRLKLTPAVEISFLPKKLQQTVARHIKNTGRVPSLAQAKKLHALGDDGAGAEAIEEVLSGRKDEAAEKEKRPAKITIKLRDVEALIPAKYLTEAEIMAYIRKVLEEHAQM